MPGNENDPIHSSNGLPALDFERHALFFDIDGTLLDIAATPDAVAVSSALEQALVLLSFRLDRAVALITGRGLDFVEERFPRYRGAVAALHGAAFRHVSGVIEQIEPDEYFQLAKDFLRQAENCVRGLLLEDKGSAVALHYRAAPEKVDMAEILVRKAQKLAGAGWQVQPGKMVFELRPAAGDKGRALRRFMQGPPFVGRQPIAFGDDLTDLPMLEAAIVLGGVGVAVGPTICRKEMASLASPDDLRAWLEKVTAGSTAKFMQERE